VVFPELGLPVKAILIFSSCLSLRMFFIESQRLAAANRKVKNNRLAESLIAYGDLSRKSHDYRFRKLIIYIISAVFNGNDTAAFHTANNGNSFTAVASEREKKSVELLIVGIDSANDIFFSFFYLSEIHRELLSPISVVC